MHSLIELSDFKPYDQCFSFMHNLPVSDYVIDGIARLPSRFTLLLKTSKLLVFRNTNTTVREFHFLVVNNFWPTTVRSRSLRTYVSPVRQLPIDFHEFCITHVVTPSLMLSCKLSFQVLRHGTHRLRHDDLITPFLNLKH